MKGILLVCLIASFFIGCDRNPAEEFGEAMMVSYQRSTDAADEASRQAIQRYIRTYRALNGEYPESLEELEGSLGAGYDLEAYDYDPRTGSLTAQ